jgi:hypothetical protein
MENWRHRQNIFKVLERTLLLSINVPYTEKLSVKLKINTFK